MKYLVCLVFLAAAVTAYDFKDTDFNEYLLEELQADYDEALDNVANVRARRDIEATTKEANTKECSRREWKKDFLCCKGDKLDQEQLEAYKDAKKQCLTEVRGNNADDSYDPFDCEKMQKIKDQMVCVSECVAKKFKMINENGELNREAILAQMRTKIGDVQWKKDSVEAFVDKCLTEAKEKKAKATEEHKDGCNRCPLEFHHCIWREFSNGCPADLRVDTPKCTKLRERFAKGDTSFLNKHFLHHYNHGRQSEEQN